MCAHEICMRAPYYNNTFLTRKYHMKYGWKRCINIIYIYIYFLFFSFRGNINPTLCIKLHTLFKRNCLEFYSKTPTHFYFTLHDIIGLLWTLENINRKLKSQTMKIINNDNNNNGKLNYTIWIRGREPFTPSGEKNRLRPSRNITKP